MRKWILAAPAPLAVAVLLAFGRPAASEKRPEPHRSPTDLALLPDGRRAVTANHTSDTASLVDLDAGKVLAEAACGRKPAAIAVSRDGRRAAVANLWAGSVSLFVVGDDSLKPAGEAKVGGFPQGLAFAPDGDRLYAVIGYADEVVEINWKTAAAAHRWAAPHDPRRVVVSADGALVAVDGEQPGRVKLWNAETEKLVWERSIEDGFNLRGLAFTPDGEALVCAHGVRRDFPVSKGNIEEGWVVDSRLTRFPLKADATPPLKQVALDERRRAVGDPCGAAFDPKGRFLAVAGSGTGELLLFDSDALPWNGGDPGDALDPKYTRDGKLRRIDLGGRPMTVAFTPDGKQAVVANYLLDAVQVVDAAEGKVVRTVALGGPEKPSLPRQGEALFYDAKRSHHQWMSCSTCHVDGHTCGLNFDTLNDASYGNPKLTPSLRGVSRTGPWTWHGWQDDLGAGVEKSYVTTMFGPKPTADETKAVVAFLETLDHPPNPNRGPDGKPTEAAERGRKVFESKGKCTRCHDGPEFTSERTYDVHLEPDGSPYKEWNPPTLRGLWSRGPFLHDGRAKTLDDLLQGPHAPEKFGVPALAPGERRDLIAYLNSL
jgi:DNA-binding beta-propeller fold protein YncE